MRRSVVVKLCSIVDAGTLAVVNASNPDAALGGGVSSALFDECGGSVLQSEMREKLEQDHDGVLEEDDCMVTSGGSSTRIRYVLHVASVDYRGVRARVGAGGTAEHSVTSAARVTTATTAALRAAALLPEPGGMSVTFPLLGAGSGGLGPAASLTAMVLGMRAFFREEPDAGITEIVFAVPEPDRFQTCQRRLGELLVLK
jgi:O-acetyl-ADP-ribose deacetylase (regulator of RNase III)